MRKKYKQYQIVDGKEVLVGEFLEPKKIHLSNNDYKQKKKASKQWLAHNRKRLFKEGVRGVPYKAHY